MNDQILQKGLVKTFDPSRISNKPEILGKYSRDLSFVSPIPPKYVVWASNTEEIENLLKLANRMKFSVIPISSSSEHRYHGDTIPKKKNTVILDLSRMDKIIHIDKKNRVVMVEPGVTFKQLIPRLKKMGLRIMTPFQPRSSKSVLASALERVPTCIPRYHWDTSDPLLCTEVVFGTGKLFRTGSAAGPGRLKDMQRTGQAQVNPMGPTQFSPFRIIQGSQGSVGVVTWASLKLELLPTRQKVFQFHSQNLKELLKVQHFLLKYRLCDELFILNDLNLACLLKKDLDEILKLCKNLSKWNLIFILSGRGELARDRIAFQEGDINELIEENGLTEFKRNKLIHDEEILRAVSMATEHPWRMRLKGGFQDIFFITNYHRILKYFSLLESRISEDVGVYIQPINQGTAYHCEFDIYYDRTDNEIEKKVKKEYLDLSLKLMDEGAFFNRPYGLWAKEAFKRHGKQTSIALQKIKDIFDPNNVLNPGVLCFEE